MFLLWIIGSRYYLAAFYVFSTQTETQVRKILDYCGLPFEESCLEFYNNKRAVRTASSEQVRQPIYASGMGQWQAFEKWLDPLKEALGPVLERYPIERVDS